MIIGSYMVASTKKLEIRVGSNLSNKHSVFTHSVNSLVAGLISSFTISFSPGVTI